MADKLVKNIDNEVWIKFTGLCKMEGIKVGESLNDIIAEHLKNKGIN